MDEKTRQLVLNLLKAAHEGALGDLQPDAVLLSAAELRAAMASIEAIRSCLHRQFEGTLLAGEARERIEALVYGHTAPASSRLVERYARRLNELLAAARNQLVAPGRRQDN